MTEEQIADAMRLYALGFSSEEMAGRYGVGGASVRRAIKQAGAAMRSVGGAKDSPLITPDVLDQARALLPERPLREDVATVAAQLNVPRKPLALALKVPSRRGAVANDCNLAKDPALDLPIGSLPPGHPLASIDAQIVASRSRPHYDGGLGSSSLARFEVAS